MVSVSKANNQGDHSWMELRLGLRKHSLVMILLQVRNYVKDSLIPLSREVIKAAEN